MRTGIASFTMEVSMTAETFVKLMEEMVDIKVHLFLESQIKTTPEIARILSEKRHTDHRRLEQIKAELVRSLTQ